LKTRSNPGHIWVHDKRSDVARPAAIKQVAQARNFYDEETESRLTRDVEVPGSAAIERLTKNRAVTPAERLHLAYYVGVMMKRIPARRRRSKEMIPGVLADVVAEIRNELTALSDQVRDDPELLAKRLTELDAAESKYARQPPPEVMRIIEEPWPTIEMVQLLFQMTWRILVTGGPQHFITSDNPAFFFSGYGLGRRQSELSFPLASTHALHGSWQRAQSDLVFLHAKKALVKEINTRVASDAERLAFYHEPAPWLFNVFKKDQPRLNAIHW
jgi:uncharacterized protein DUF4238